MEVRVEVIGVREVARDFVTLSRTVLDPVEDALERGGRWVTFEARDLLRGQIRERYLVHYPRSISSETERGAGRLSMIVGPESGRPQGGMGLGVEFGSVNTRPIPHLFQAFDDRVESIIDRASRNVARWPS